MNPLTCGFKLESGAEHCFEVDIERPARTLDLGTLVSGRNLRPTSAAMVHWMSLHSPIVLPR
jgi:hypothetical protein